MGIGVGRRITVHEASVRTATVEVKTLTISGKQVTLAVFRQLMMEWLLDNERNQLRGEVWGWVNYHQRECADYGEHRHVVWQKGDELRQAIVTQNCGYPLDADGVALVKELWNYVCHLDQLFIAV